MVYATVSDFLKHYQLEEFRELGNIDNDSEIEIESRIYNALSLASSEVDQIIGIKYPLPLPTNYKVPFLVWANVVIARKNLSSYEEREKPRLDYEDVIERLRYIAEGKSALVDTSGNIIKPITENQSVNRYQGKMYYGQSKAPIPNFSGNVYRRYLK
jgi:phage gp36-like protein